MYGPHVHGPLLTYVYVRAVRADSTALALFEQVEGRDDKCLLHFVQYFDMKGCVPVFVLNSKLPDALQAAIGIRERFEKDDEVDRAERDELARAIKEKPQNYTAEEDSMMKTVRDKLKALKEEDFDELESPDHLVKMGKIFFNGESSAIARGSVIIDASVEECAAWEMSKMSRENKKVQHADGALESALHFENGHHNIYHLVSDLGIPGFLPREFLLSQIWMLQEDRLVVGYRSLELVAFPLRPQYVRGTSLALWEYEELQQAGNMPQTRATYWCQVDIKGRIPKFVVNGQAANQLAYLSTMRKRFDKSLENDCATRALNIEMIEGHDDEYSAKETKLLVDGEQLFAMFDGMKVKVLKMASPLVMARIAKNSGDSHAWGYATTTVRAKPKEVRASHNSCEKRALPVSTCVLRALTYVPS